MSRLALILTAFKRREVSEIELASRVEQLLTEPMNEREAILAELNRAHREGILNDALFERFSTRLLAPEPRSYSVPATESAADMTRAVPPDAPETGTLDISQTAATVVASEATLAEPAPPEPQDSSSPHPAIDTSRQTPLSPGMVLKERFVLEEILGVGGMSIVFKARDLRKEEAQDRSPHVAIKVLGEAFKSHPDSLLVLQREAKKAQTLAHPNIVTVYDFDRDGNTIYMTMECLDGEPLNEIIRRCRRHGMSLKDAMPYIDGITQALTYAHKNNIIHSDLKPANVFHTQDHVVKVLDFGIARAKKRPGQHQSDTGVFDAGRLGALTPAYASCEMLEGDEPDPRDDIYALACITYELLAGHHPFDKKPALQARNEGLAPRPIKGLTRRQWRALRRGLAFKRAVRIPTATDFLAGLKPAPLITRRTLMLTSLLLVVSAYYAYELSQFRQERADQLESVEPVEVSPEQEVKIAEYLEAAEFYLALGHLAAPPGDSALDVYQRILEIDPGHRQAREGVREIADQYETLARSAWRAGDLEEAETLVQLGLRARPAHADLLEIQEEIEQHHVTSP